MCGEPVRRRVSFWESLARASRRCGTNPCLSLQRLASAETGEDFEDRESERKTGEDFENREDERKTGEDFEDREKANSGRFAYCRSREHGARST